MKKKSFKLPKSKQKRAPRGEGSVFPDRRNGGWKGKVPVGRYPDGSTKYVEVRGATQAEAVAKKKAVLPPGPTTTVAEWAARWLEGLQKRPLTVDGYRHNVTSYIVPVLGSVQVRALTPYTVEQAAREWGETLISNTVRLILSHLRACLSDAVRAGLIATNPVASARKPKAVPAKIDPFTPDQVAAIVDEASSARHRCVIAVVAATGCRRGEAIALEVPDFDPVTERISITKGHIGRHGIGEPKSAQSNRTIRVPKVAVPAVLNAIGSRTSGPMFLTGTGERINSTSYWDYYTTVLRHLKLKHRKPHQLRHSVATMMIAAGAGLADVAAYLGDTVETIVRTYLHPTGADAADVLDRLYGGGKVADISINATKTLKK